MDTFGLNVRRSTRLTLGLDAQASAYHLDTVDGQAYFLKVRKGNFDPVALALPTHLHGLGIREVVAPLAGPTHGEASVLHPFFAGREAYAEALSHGQWLPFGKALRAIHAAQPPAGMLRNEDYGATNRDAVRPRGGRRRAMWPTAKGCSRGRTTWPRCCGGVRCRW
ncbi:MAG TPA: hypothetical protein VNM16_12855 [Bacillota bacterium]|nr:hypothetical protein [Bacillota bacterium]